LWSRPREPTLLARLKRLPWHRVPVADRTRDRGHGRIEHRTLKVVTVGHFGFPHAAQVLQVTRKTRPLRTRRWRTVTIYAITSLPFEQARPARLADLLRGHWAIEALHQLRDVTFAEDASHVRSGAGPSVMACLRNLVIGVLCRAGPVNLAAALRRHARDPTPTPRHPRDQPRMKPTSRQNAGALPEPEGCPSHLRCHSTAAAQALRWWSRSRSTDSSS
jgi:Transposase DDE domain